MQYTNRQKFSDTRLPYRFHVIESGMELFKQKLNQPIPGKPSLNPDFTNEKKRI